jgi:hypothetical protein
VFKLAREVVGWKSRSCLSSHFWLCSIPMHAFIMCSAPVGWNFACMDTCRKTTFSLYITDPTN